MRNDKHLRGRKIYIIVGNTYKRREIKRKILAKDKKSNENANIKMGYE